MDTATKQFAWKDRDTAGQDLLQLVYHGPPSISRLSARLLTSICSNEIVSQLCDIVLDEDIDRWIRIYALRACSSVSDDIYIPEFKPLVQVSITEYERQQTGKNRFLSEVLDLYDFALFADRHPQNRDWFFDLLSRMDLSILVRFIISTLKYEHSSNFKAILLSWLKAIVNTHQEKLDSRPLMQIASQHFDLVESWLDDQFADILEISLKNPESTLVITLARQWKRLRYAIEEQFDDWHVVPPLPRHKRSPIRDYESSLAYQHLFELYERALVSDTKAYKELVRIARTQQGNIPARAVATHWIGKLSTAHNVYPFLVHQLQYAHVNLKFDCFDSPIRYEAGEALLEYKTSQTWEVFVDSYFIYPRDDLLRFQDNWIAYLTDILSGEHVKYSGLKYTKVRRGWFHALADVDVDSL